MVEEEYKNNTIFSKIGTWRFIGFRMQIVESASEIQKFKMTDPKWRTKFF